jgi:hypothetical protein
MTQPIGRSLGRACGPSGAAILVGLALAIAAAGTPAQAITIHADKFTDDSAPLNICGSNAYANCTSHAYITATSLKGDDARFKTGFDIWNDAQPAGAKWTLVNGGALPASSLSIMDFQAVALSFTGGMNLDVNWAYGGADLTSYVWAQAVFANYKADGTPSGVIVDPYFLLDTYMPGPKGPPCADVDSTDLKDNHYCGPAYPIQYGNRRLYDHPRGPWPNASFDASAMLAKLDREHRKLTVYEGIGWGYSLKATPQPEPAVWTLMLLGFGAVGAVLRRRPPSSIAA